MTTIIALHFINRICYFFEERKHLLSRYDNSLKRLLTDVFFFSNASIFAIIFIFVLIIVTYNSYESLNTKKEVFYLPLTWLASTLFSDFLQMVREHYLLVTHKLKKKFLERLPSIQFVTNKRSPRFRLWIRYGTFIFLWVPENSSTKYGR